LKGAIHLFIIGEGEWCQAGGEHRRSTPGIGTIGPFSMESGEPVKSWTDTELVHACRTGDSAAWGELLARYGPLVYGISKRYRLTPEDCVDVFGQVCKIMLENLEQIRSSERLAGYISTTTQRECLAVIRDRERRQHLCRRLQDEEPQLGDPEKEAEEFAREAQRGFLVRRALNQQDERCRKLLWFLFYDEEHPEYVEISRRMHMPVASIGPTRSRCLERFRRTLCRLGWGRV
jgi:RNA polymerase sigma factor (sigma-70 family)